MPGGFGGGTMPESIGKTGRSGISFYTPAKNSAFIETAGAGPDRSRKSWTSRHTCSTTTTVTGLSRSLAVALQ